MVSISKEEALGRVVGAARMLAGLGQAGLASLSGVSASTVSNIEKGRTSTPASVKAVRLALREKGVNLNFGNNQASASICFVDRNAEEED